jgi:hypothetical protein
MLFTTTEQPIPKDVVVALLGAAAGVAGLVLVFVGVLLTTIGTYPGATSAEALRPYRRGAWAGVGIFAGSIATVALAVAWLVVADSYWLYALTVTAFAMLLVALVIFAASVVKATT